MKFYLYEQQFESYGGCDYTIACGERVQLLKRTDGTDARDLIEAREIAISSEYLGEGGEDEDFGPISSDPGDQALHSARILVVTKEHEIDLGAYIERARKRVANAQRSDTETAERAELERLQAKYK